MILILELAFLVAGVYALFTAKMPAWIVGKGYKAEGSPVRLLGALMAALLPGVFCGSFGIGIIAGMSNFDPTLLVIVFEIGAVIAVAVIVTVALRRIRQPDSPAQPFVSSISDKKLE
ncbi:MAG: hypothetical protein K8S20_04605 [Chloroflexi bacterium]|jgi:predicted lipid-binding transport protein (Tim44 family)|nr:hypothetical protein [Chloroflexota bacterium]